MFYFACYYEKAGGKMVLKYELKKILIKQKGIILILALLLYKSIFSFYEIQSVYYLPSHEDREIYEAYICYLNGNLTEEKEKFILVEKEKIESVKSQYNYISIDLYDYRLSEEEYIEKYHEIQEYLKRDRAFQEVWSKYKYVMLNPSNRYFIPYDIPSLSVDRLDYLLVMVIIVLTVNFFFTERDTNMLVYIKSSKKGRGSTATTKWGIMMALSIIVVLLISGVEYIITIFYMDTVYLNYPLQSLEFYANSPYSLTIGQVWGSIIALRCIGLASFCSIVIVLGEITRSKILTLFIPTATMFLQGVIGTDKSLAYRIPFLTGLIKGTGYFRGNATVTMLKGTAIEETVKVFSNIPKDYLIKMIILALICIISSLGTVVLSYKNKQHKKKIVYSLLLILFLLSGCNTVQNDNVYTHNLNISKNFLLVQNENYYILGEDTNAVRIDKKSGEKEKLIRNSFYECTDPSVISRNYLQGENYYYYTYNKNARVINQINLESLTEKNIFTTNTEDKYYFLNLYLKYVDFKNIEKIWSFFIADDDLFLVMYDGRVVKVDIKSNKKEVVIDEGMFRYNISFDGNYIYYINSNLELKRYNIHTKESTVIIDKRVTRLYLMPDGILCADKNALYSVNKDGTSLKRIINASVNELSSDEKYIYYTERNSNNLYRISKDGGKGEIISDENILDFEVLTNSNYIYCRINGSYEPRYELLNKE